MNDATANGGLNIPDLLDEVAEETARCYTMPKGWEIRKTLDIILQDYADRWFRDWQETVRERIELLNEQSKDVLA